MSFKRNNTEKRFRTFTARISDEAYELLDDWAWHHRKSVSESCEILLLKSLLSSRTEAKSSESSG